MNHVLSMTLNEDHTLHGKPSCPSKQILILSAYLYYSEPIGMVYAFRYCRRYPSSDI